MRKRKHTLIKIIAAVTSGIILTASIPASAAWAESNNIITNSTFDYNTTGWGTYKESGGNASLRSGILRHCAAVSERSLPPEV